MDSAELAKLIQELEDRVERLRALYEQYFMGIERIEPLTLRKEIDRRLWVLRREQIRNTGTRFKLQTVVQRYNTYQQYWQRIVREIETGTYQRDLGRAAQRFGEAATTALGRRRQKMFEKGQARRVERDGQRRGQSSVPPGGTPSTTPGAFAPPAGATGGTPSTAPGAFAPPAGATDRTSDAPELYEDVPIEDAEVFLADRPAATPHLRSSSPAPRLPPRPHPTGSPRPPSTKPLQPNASAARTPGAGAPLRAASTTPGASPRLTPTAPGVAPRAPLPVAPKRPPAVALPEASPLRPAAAPAAARPAPVAKPPAPVVATSVAASPAGVLPPTRALAPVAPPDDSGLSQVRLRQLYGAYVEAKRQANESTAAITYDKVAANLRDTANQLRAKHQGREIDFEVILKNGKPVLKPVLKR